MEEIEIYKKVKSAKKQKKKAKKKAKQKHRKTLEIYEAACSNVSGLTSAFESIQSIDEKLMGLPDEISQMKNRIFDAIKYYCDQLPQSEE